VLTAVTPLFVVIGGGITIEMLVPIVSALGGMEGISGRAALALFLVASVHVALMVMVMKVAGTMVAGWQVFGLASPSERGGSGTAMMPAAHIVQPLDIRVPAQSRAGMVAASTYTGEAASGSAGSQPGTVPGRRTVVVTQTTAGAAPSLPPLPQRRARGIGSRFAAPTTRKREALR